MVFSAPFHPTHEKSKHFSVHSCNILLYLNGLGLEQEVLLIHGGQGKKYGQLSLGYFNLELKNMMFWI